MPMNDELIERALRGEATRDELDALLAWRRSSPDHERQVAQLERLLVGVEGLRGELRMARPPTAADLLHRARGPAPKSESRRWRWIAWPAAAAAVGVAVASGWHLARQTEGGSHGAEIVTGVAEMTTVELRDGSVVRLGPASRLSIGVRPDMREVTLDGRAFFAIAQGRGPFRVRTRLGEARVLGTRFELATRDDDLELVVVEGRVALDAPANTVEVRGGQASYVAHGTATPPVAIANADSVLRWIGKFVVFQSTALRDAAREVEKTYGIHVRITDSVLAAQTVTATFTDRGPARVVEVLCSVVNARCTTVGDTVTVSRR
jgi:transmembrane sensor